MGGGSQIKIIFQIKKNKGTTSLIFEDLKTNVRGRAAI